MTSTAGDTYREMRAGVARACAAFGASRAAKGITNSPRVVAQFEDIALMKGSGQTNS